VSPRVSVIIATYNWSSVLPYSIGSVLRQTMGDFEVLVVGDGCTDDSEQVVTAIGDSRVRWINLPENTKHQSGPNNEGLRQARGELIAYLGHDDLWLPHHLEAHVATIDASGADITGSLIGVIETDGGDVWPFIPRPEHGAWVPPSCTVHRRSLTDTLGGWRSYRELKIQPEVDLWQRARDAGFRFVCVPRLTAIKFSAAQRRNVYRIRPHHEQAAWTDRIASEPDLEATLMAEMIASGRMVKRMRYADLLRQVIAETVIRVQRRLNLLQLFPRRKGAAIEDFRRFKGL
jgi:glycosyltransferase involved in cell wall biosynthesis